MFAALFSDTPSKTLKKIMPRHAPIVIILGFAAVTVPSDAAITTVSPWHTAGNGQSTDYGLGWFQVENIALYHVGKDAFGSGPNTAQMQIWALGFSDLQGISYSATAVADLSILPVSGWLGGLSLYGFDLGLYSGGDPNVEYQIWNGDFTSLLASDTLTIGALHQTVDVSLFSTNGFHVQFESAGYVGIDNYRIAGDASAIPEPSVWLMSLSMASCGLLLRRRF